ncbi:MFS transporter [Candidatus Cetobacterium colombiensis]|uniref:MFS transporter n=1 Tax=Candidatus Cetobacterium colombiensis TaxID=3073100 RepID=A0ABU4W6L3_9FUSO|nr:MFS transporter [Candidatus Cetobacterium colombiensis]MDX8335171.1 MFS transporter [Candidatus Cetobacterium colombiensis]
MFYSSYEKNKFLITIEGMSANMLSLGIQGFALTALALYFKCEPFWISLITTLPLGLQLLQIFLGKYYSLFKTKKKALLFSAAAARIPMCFLFFIVLFDKIDYRYLVGIVFVYSFFSAFLSGIWTSSVGDIIKKEDRGRFFSKRFTLISISTIAFSYIVSNALNYRPGKTSILILTLIIAISAITTLILLYFHDIPNFQEDKKEFSIAKPLKDPNFFNFLTFIAMWNFSIEFTKPYFYYFAVVDLNAPYSILGLSSSLTAILSIGAFFVYGKLVERIGYKKLLSFGIGVTSYVVVFYFLMTKETVNSLIMLDAIGTAIGWSAINLSLFSLLLELSSPDRDSYTAAYSLAVGVLGLTGALLGGYLANFLNGKTILIFGDSYAGLKLMFFISLFLRFYCMLLLTKVRAYQKNLYYPGLYPSLIYLLRNKR